MQEPIIANLSKGKSLQIPRKDLPQVDFKQFDNIKKILQNNGITCIDTVVTADSIKPVQDQLNTDKIQEIIETGQVDEDRILLLSNNNYIPDGHHYWAAKVFIDPTSEINVIRIDMNIIDLILWLKNQKFVEFKAITEGQNI